MRLVICRLPFVKFGERERERERERAPPLASDRHPHPSPRSSRSQRHGEMSCPLLVARQAKVVVRDFVLEMRMGRRMMVLSPTGQLKATTCSLNSELCVLRITRASQAAWYANESMEDPTKFPADFVRTRLNMPSPPGRHRPTPPFESSV